MTETPNPEPDPDAPRPDEARPTRAPPHRRPLAEEDADSPSAIPVYTPVQTDGS